MAFSQRIAGLYRCQNSWLKDLDKFVKGERWTGFCVFKTLKVVNAAKAP